MPATINATTTENQAISALLQLAEKARRGGGHGVSKPGSRGGHPWTDAHGNVRYGPQPHQVLPRGGQGQRVLTSRGPSANLRAAVSRQRVTARTGPSGKKPQSKTQAQHKMLFEMDRAIRTGKDPHGNKLSAANIEKLRFLATSLRTDLKSGAKKEIAAADPVHTGVMVAFYIDTFSSDAAVRLQIPGGETWDALHLTLAYLGDSTELGPDAEGQLYRLVSDFARSSSPLEGEVSGIGLFNNNEEGDSNAFYASFDSPALPAFRTRLMGMLEANGIMPVQNHGFTPHITLQYVPKGQPLPQVELPAMPMIFNKVTVKWGDKRTDFSLGMVEKEVKDQIVARAGERQAFTVFKDKQGRYRWVGVSGSAAEDADGETVSLKALQEDTALKDVTGEYGPLNWWHTSIQLGTCDFNVMDGPLLVESGTFINDGVAQAVEKALNDRVFEPGMSLEFEHSEGWPPVLPGRVYQKINKVGRALLPAHKASNLLTRFQVYNLNSALAEAKKEVMIMIPEEKLKLLERTMPKELLDGLLSGNEIAIKSAELAGLSFKAAAPVVVEPPVEVTPVVEAAPPVVVEPPAPVAAAPVVVDAPPAAVTSSEDAPGDIDSDALFETLSQSVADKVLTAMTASNTAATATATKETTEALGVMTLALKENTTALNKVITENVALKSRLDALEGVQPPAVRARASQQGGLPAEQLSEAHKELVSTDQQDKDPYAWAKTLVPGLERAPRG